jgi:hypothetical protein
MSTFAKNEDELLINQMLENTDLPTRVINALANGGIETVRQLRARKSDLFQIRNIGPGGIKICRELIERAEHEYSGDEWIEARAHDQRMKLLQEIKDGLNTGQLRSDIVADMSLILKELLEGVRSKDALIERLNTQIYKMKREINGE